MPRVARKIALSITPALRETDARSASPRRLEESVNEIEKSKRVRSRKASLQLQSALNQAEVLNDAAPTPENAAKMNLLKVRLAVLSRKAARERVDTVATLTDRVTALEAENEHLMIQHEQDAAEIERLRTVCRVAATSSFDEIAMRGQNGRN